MKYMVGYQLLSDTSWTKAIIKHKEHIYEVYFSWGDIPNGRSIFSANSDFQAFEAQSRLLSDLKRFSAVNIAQNLLLNANCYGQNSQSRHFFEKIGEAIDYLSLNCSLRSVTTTSPLIAKFIKNNFSELELRSSVNMEIGTIQGMDYLREYFDAYYMQRELNRNLSEIVKLKKWCKSNGKKLYMLANSGCLNNCSAHNFHDNLVAHEHEIKTMDNAFDFKGICHDYLNNPDKQPSIVRDTNYVRPENIHLYETYFDAVKLATRSNRNPVAVLEAYIAGKFTGNVMELLEPNHAESFYPYVLENTAFPNDFAAKVMNCDKDCQACNYCSDVFENIKVNLNKGENILC